MLGNCFSSHSFIDGGKLKLKTWDWLVCNSFLGMERHVRNFFLAISPKSEQHILVNLTWKKSRDWHQYQVQWQKAVPLSQIHRSCFSHLSRMRAFYTLAECEDSGLKPCPSRIADKGSELIICSQIPMVYPDSTCPLISDTWLDTYCLATSVAK